MDTQKQPTLDIDLDKMKERNMPGATPKVDVPQATTEQKTAELVEASPVELAKKRNEARRCGHPDCKKRLVLTDITCRCGITHCMTHRIGSAHNCTFDYKAASRPSAEQSKSLSAVPQKLNKI